MEYLLSNILIIMFIGNIKSYGLNKCLNPPLVANVNLERLLGTWYGQYVGTKKEAEKKCVTYTNQLVIDDNGTVMVNIHSTWRVDKQNKSVDFKSYPIKNTSASKIVWQNIIF
nr:uncharacterized protein LOC111426791 [Onthophagus taurus]